MSHDRVNYRDVEPKAPSMHFLREALDCENLGLTVLDTDGEWTGMEHDHAGDDHEEVYLLLEGSATMTVDGEAVELDEGDAIRVDPDATRRIQIDEESLVVAAGAP